jgi:predicted 2-oxoglutarate/Fe(II)-dependent dioxygenase YbiX/peroxiredoxin
MPFEPKPASEQGLLALGERLCDLPFIEVIHLADSAEQAEPELMRLAEHVRRFAVAETHLVGVTRASAADNGALARRLKLPFPLLSDPAGCLHKAAGLAAGAAPRTLVFDTILRLEEEISDDGAGSQADQALAHAEARFAKRRPGVITAQAPALVIPNLIDPDHCRRLMAFWDRGTKRENVTAAHADSAPVDPASKIRSDVVVFHPSPESNELLGNVSRRLVPEISTAFNFAATRFEPFRVGCYDAASGGRFAPHRDNARSATSHRRYALTLNLNTGDYEGGYLRLPEYGPHLYAPPAGGCVVFSCSLLHMATPVTKGRRFVVVAFFWGEQEQLIFEHNHADMIPGGTNINRIPR